MGRVVTFGELMLRLTPPEYLRIEQTDRFHAVFGGAEANVAASLSNFGHHAFFVTKLPPHSLGEAASRHLRRYGVSTEFVVRGGERLGIYFLEEGVSLRPGKVIYDRKHSSFTTLRAGELDWEKILRGADLLHLSGITLAVGEGPRQAAFEAVRTAKRLGMTVSFDFNYRSKLWTVEEAAKAYRAILPDVDLMFGGPSDIVHFLGYPMPGDGTEEMMRHALRFRQVIADYGLKRILFTRRVVHSSSENSLTAYSVSAEEGVAQSDSYRFGIVDRVGGGDAFAAGYLHGWLQPHWTERERVQFAVKAAVLKHTYVGDVNQATEEEVHHFGQGDVKR